MIKSMESLNEVVTNGSKCNHNSSESQVKGEQLTSIQIRVVANLCKYKYKNVLF